jgi:hypothetical protein
MVRYEQVSCSKVEQKRRLSTYLTLPSIVQVYATDPRTVLGLSSGIAPTYGHVRWWTENAVACIDSKRWLENFHSIGTPYILPNSDVIRPSETHSHDPIASAADVKSYIKCCDATSAAPAD